jgi:hypothetical protein
MIRCLLILVTAALTLQAAGCGSDEGGSATTQAAPPPLPQGSEPVELDPADFVAEIDNPYWPMAPGSRWVSRETDGEGGELRVVVTVTDRTKTILGIAATVVHDLVTDHGVTVEDTYDWYAQDRWGNVWYMGERTAEYEDGKVVTRAGSWEAGVDGAQPGIALPGSPEVGTTYRQEYKAGEAEDQGEVLSLDEKVEVPFGSFDNVLMTRDTTPLEPDVVEHKFYARGVGPVLALTVSGGADREELILHAR